MGELIREQILLLTHEEVPHSVAIAIEKVEGSTNDYSCIRYHIHWRPPKRYSDCKGGGMLKAIGSAAREQIQN